MNRTNSAGVALLFALCATATPSAGRPQEPSTAGVLDRYAAGQVQEAVMAVATIPNLTRFTARYPSEALAWIGVGEDAGRRRRAAASFVLELTRSRLDSDWRLLRDLIEWTCADLRAAGPVDAFERAWHEAALALAGRARDRIWLLGEVPYLPGQKPRRRPAGANSPAHLLHAAGRLPESSSIRLEWIMAWTWGRDREPTRNVEAGRIPMIPGRRVRQLDAVAALEPLTDDPVVGPEASVRIAYLQFLLNDHPAALATASGVTSTAASPAVRYVAHVIAGRSLDAMQERDRARHAYEEALIAVPGAESASLALSALRLISDDGADTSAVVDRALVRTRDGDDPWRIFLYGSFRDWPARLQALRAEVAR